MAIKSLAYDHAAYIVRNGNPMGEAGGAANTQYGKFVAFTALRAFSAQLTVTVAGTNTGHGFQIVQISGTATTVLGSTSLGVTVPGSTINLVLSPIPGGLSMAQGDVLAAVSLVDVTGKVAVSYETAVQPLANVTE
jgi:hypothetical protein